MTDIRYIIKWHYGSDPQYRWFVRGIKQDGTFYGEVLTINSRSNQLIKVEGKIAPNDLGQILERISNIRHLAMAPSDIPWTGLLAEGPVENPTVLFHYLKGTISPNLADNEFLKIIEILTPYMVLG